VRGARLRRNAETSLFACVKEQRLLAGKSQGALFGPAPHLHKSKQHEYLMRRPANFFFHGRKMQMRLLSALLDHLVAALSDKGKISLVQREREGTFA
jgi:hypothetical protein